MNESQTARNGTALNWGFYAIGSGGGVILLLTAVIIGIYLKRRCEDRRDPRPIITINSREAISGRLSPVFLSSNDSLRSKSEARDVNYDRDDSASLSTTSSVDLSAVVTQLDERISQHKSLHKNKASS